MAHSCDRGPENQSVQRTVRRVAGKNETGFDPARTLGLLWRVGAKKSRTGLTIDSIVDAAVSIADSESLDAVSMRRIADRLGVGTMSLYTHVPGREDLVDLMIDHVQKGLYSALDEPASSGDWRAGLRFVAEQNWHLIRRHRWVLDAQGGRAVLGPNVSDKYEAELRVLDGIGLTDVQMDSVLTLVLNHVAGSARALAQVDRVREDSGMTDEQWWSATAPVLESVMDPSRYTVSSRVGTAAAMHHEAASDPVHEYRFGVERILDGVAVLIEKG